MSYQPAEPSQDAGTSSTLPPGAVQPSAEVTGASGPRAGFGRRFASAFIDGLIVAIPIGAISAAFGADTFFGERDGSRVVILTQYSGITLLVRLVIEGAYTTFFEGSPSGQTPGKRLLGIRVMDLSAGGSIGYGRALIRYLGKFVSGIAIGLGFLWMLWDKEKQTWHDMFANSVVVPVDNYPVERWPG